MLLAEAARRLVVDANQGVIQLEIIPIGQAVAASHLLEPVDGGGRGWWGHQSGAARRDMEEKRAELDGRLGSGEKEKAVVEDELAGVNCCSRGLLRG